LLQPFEASSAMLGKLMPTGGGPPIPLLKPKLLIGRQSTCDIPLSYPAVSSRHCELEFRDAYWRMRDLGSSNGTRINGIVCTEGWLMPEDILGVARHCYRMVYTPPVGRPVPPDTPASGGVTAGGGVGTRKPLPPGPPRPRQGFSLGQLVPCGGGKPILLNKEALIVGRQPGCDIVLPDPAVSSRHCRLERKNGLWFVHDLGSRNGVRVNGVRCQSECLPPGVMLWIAGARFRVVYETAAETRAAPPEQGQVMAKGLLEKAGLTEWQPAEEDE
jgi:adenylate cyclase